MSPGEMQRETAAHAFCPQELDMDVRQRSISNSIFHVHPVEIEENFFHVFWKAHLSG